MRDAARKRGAFRLALLAVMLLAAGLRFDAALADRRFHPDEALYSTFARDAVAFGDWWLSGPLDKPPLSLYASALAMHLTAARLTPQGVIDVPPLRGELAARLPSLFAGLLLVPLWSRIAEQTGGPRLKPLLTALLLAVAPFAVGFSAAAFTDMLMLSLASAALLAVLRGHGAAAGALLALSIAAKPQAAFFSPLILAALLITAPAARRQFMALRWLLALLTGLALLLLWDALRPGESFLSVGNRHINPGRPFAAPAEWPDRLRLWLAYSADLLGPPWLTLALGLLAVLGGLRTPLNRLMLAFVLLYSALHTVSALPLFDRYLLPVLPPLALMAAHGMLTLTRTAPPFRAAALMSAMLLMVMVMAAHPYDAGQHGRTAGDTQALAARLNALPFAAILYDHGLGWELDYYLGAWTDKRRVYYPTPAAFAADAPLNPEAAPRYLVAPAGAQLRPWLEAAARAGFQPQALYAPPGFRLVRLR